MGRMTKPIAIGHQVDKSALVGGDSPIKELRHRHHVPGDIVLLPVHPSTARTQCERFSTWNSAFVHTRLNPMTEGADYTQRSQIRIGATIKISIKPRDEESRITSQT